jgi:hypothetical protein
MNAQFRHGEDNRETVRVMRADGKTLQQIANVLHMTRPAVAGLVRRMGLIKRESAAYLGKPRGWTAHKIAKARQKVPDAPTPIGPIGAFPDGLTCRHIPGEPDESFQCCGLPGFPYCDFHRGTNYLKRGKA